ncbi:MAG: cupin domain-containing protein [Promethearchaeota archaeon]
MKHFEHTKITKKPVTQFGSEKTAIQVFISEEEAPNFIMRRFEIQPGGNIGVHNHPWEHEMFVLEGKMQLIDEKGDKEEVHAGEFIFMPPNESHGYENTSDQPVSFICVIPKNS